MKSIIGRILLIILGILMIVLGVYIVKMPVISLVSMAGVTSTLLLVAGAISLINFFSKNGDEAEKSGASLIRAIIDLLLGGYILFNLGGVALTLPYIISIWLMFRGVFSFIIAIDLRVIPNSHWVWLLIGAFITIAVGFLGLMYPIIASLGVSLIIALQFIVGGIVTIIEAVIGKTNDAEVIEDEIEFEEEEI